LSGIIWISSKGGVILEEIKGKNLSIDLKVGVISFKPEPKRQIKLTEYGIEVSPTKD
jgi:hypothetical protein